ncbi:hypothetical protein OG417_04315 [Actinoallomurus sp. NBC_01490]|uniref:hypothetical protein n=1 Tax=Actinoallomurus sp. NBC_01490 TaxID=2903557 RepID=UPI002E3740A6|nr:hypothetical protein [Actinoallomurus sp. NBC_01490]
MNKTLAESKTISEEDVIARTVHDAVPTQQKVDNAAWRARNIDTSQRHRNTSTQPKGS